MTPARLHHKSFVKQPVDDARDRWLRKPGLPRDLSSRDRRLAVNAAQDDSTVVLASILDIGAGQVEEIMGIVELSHRQGSLAVSLVRLVHAILFDRNIILSRLR
jgi:hypothetical protein